MAKLLFLLVFIGLLASCRSSRKIQTAITKRDTASKIIDKKENDTILRIKSMVEKINKNHIDYKTFSAKVNVDYKGSDGKKYDVNANLRMVKDSAIWISVNAVLGFEAMRVLITRDSVKLMDKLNKTYTLRSVGYLQELTKLPLDLSTLQHLIIGNPVFFDSTINYYTSINGITTLLSIDKWFKNLLTINETDNTIVHSKLDDADITRSRTADLSYSEYEIKKGPFFSTKRNIVVTEKNRLDIKLDFKQYDFNVDVSFPFTIPKNYERQ